MRVFFVLALILATPLGAQETKDNPEGEFTLHASAELVVLDVAVKNRQGANISGLAAQNFRIYEDNRPQEIKQFSAGDLPVTVGIVLDGSGSMYDKHTQAVQAALNFVRTSNPNDQAFVVNFNDAASLGLGPRLPFSDNIPLLERALDQTTPQGRTALYDALYLAARKVSEGMWERRALLLISDGGDNASRHILSDVVKMVQQTGVTIYAIGLYDENDPDRRPAILRRLSELSGGEAFPDVELPDLASVCSRIASDIRTRYTLAYTPEHEASSSRERMIRVEVTSPRGERLRVRTRRSYRLPEAP